MRRKDARLNFLIRTNPLNLSEWETSQWLTQCWWSLKTIWETDCGWTTRNEEEGSYSVKLESSFNITLSHACFAEGLRRACAISNPIRELLPVSYSASFSPPTRDITRAMEPLPERTAPLRSRFSPLVSLPFHLPSRGSPAGVSWLPATLERAGW